MFDKLFEFIKIIWSDLMPFYIVREYQLCCILRFGIYHRISGPGIHFKLPFADFLFRTYANSRTEKLAAQTLTTLDGKNIIVRAIVRFRIADIKKRALNVWSDDDILGDSVQGIICNLVSKKNYCDISEGIENEVLTTVYKTAKECWGIEVEKITFSDLAIIKSLRIINNN